MEVNFIFKNMDIEQSENSGLLIARTKIWLPEKDIIQSPSIILHTKSMSYETVSQINTEIYIPNNNIIYGGLKK